MQASGDFFCSCVRGLKEDKNYFEAIFGMLCFLHLIKSKKILIFLQKVFTISIPCFAASIRYKLNFLKVYVYDKYQNHFEMKVSMA